MADLTTTEGRQSFFQAGVFRNLQYWHTSLTEGIHEFETEHMGLAYINLSAACRLKNELVQAEDYGWKAISICRQLGKTVDLGRAYSSLGLTYLAQHKWTEARTHFESACQIWQQLDSHLGKIWCRVFFLKCELAQSNREQAQMYLHQLDVLITQHDPRRREQYWEPIIAPLRQQLSMLPAET